MAAAKPDVLLIFTVEHWANFFLNHYPAFCVGRAESFTGPVEEWLDVPKARLAGDPELASALLEASYQAGFEPSFADELLLDHGTMLPLHFLNPKMHLPVVPVIVNALTPPMPTPRRCFELGQILGRSLESQERRVAVIATGGLSHWPGEPNAGQINAEFDQEFLKLLTDGEFERLAEYRHETIAQAGSGAHEVRTWIAVAGGVGGWQAQILAYEPVAPWATGCGLVRFTR